MKLKEGPTNIIDSMTPGEGVPVLGRAYQYYRFHDSRGRGSCTRALSWTLMDREHT